MNVIQGTGTRDMLPQTDNTSIVAIQISLISNLVLTAGKLIVGMLFHSQVLIADGVHNAGDVIATMAALGSAKVAKKPRDFDHPYGHGRAEILGSGSVAIVMLIAALFIVWHSLQSFLSPAEPASWIALFVAGISLIWKQVLYVYCMRIGRAQKSKSVIATAYDHLADVYASFAAVIGIGATLVGEAFGISWLSYGDAISGLIVAWLVIKLAYHMGREAVDILMDRMLEPEQLEAYTELVLTVPEVRRVDRIRAREHGSYVIIDLRVAIPAQLNVQEGHDVARSIKEAIMSEHRHVEEVLIHFNPWYDDHTPAR